MTREETTKIISLKVSICRSSFIKNGKSDPDISLFPKDLSKMKTELREEGTATSTSFTLQLNRKEDCNLFYGLYLAG
jgi:hypothetical protein